MSRGENRVRGGMCLVLSWGGGGAFSPSAQISNIAQGGAARDASLMLLVMMMIIATHEEMVGFEFINTIRKLTPSTKC